MVRMIETDCTVEYKGRGHTFRDRGHRLLIIKDDDSFLVHRSTGVKPLNYMTNVMSIHEDTVDPDGLHRITVRSKPKKNGAGEEITVVMHSITMDLTVPMEADTSKSVIYKTEAQLQAWMTAPSNWNRVFGKDRLFISREVDVGNGSVDLMGIKADGSGIVVVEMKRHAHHNDVYQVERYREALGRIASDDRMFDGFRNQLLDKANIIGASPEVIALITAMSPDCLTNTDCWLVASDADDEVDEFSGQHDIKAVTLGHDWTHDTVPVDMARKASTTESDDDINLPDNHPTTRDHNDVDDTSHDDGIGTGCDLLSILGDFQNVP